MYDLISFLLWLFLFLGTFFGIVGTILFGVSLLRILISWILDKGGK